MFRPRTRESLVINDATIIFRNFKGREGMYNREGDRNFGVLLDEASAPQLEADGWNVKYLKPKEQGDTPQPWLSVSVSYKHIPPKIAMITYRGKTILDEDMVELLDLVEIQTVDVNISPYEWSVNGNSGRKAYLKSLYLTVREDPLDLKYAHVPEIGAGPMQFELEAEVPVSRNYDFDGEIVEPMRELGR